MGIKASEREGSIQLDPGEQIYVSARLARISQNSLTFSVISQSTTVAISAAEQGRKLCRV